MTLYPLDDILLARKSESAIARMEAAPTIVEAAEIMLAHITENSPGFTPEALSAARQWCRCMFYQGAAEGTRRTHALRDRQAANLDGNSLACEAGCTKHPASVGVTFDPRKAGVA